MKRLSVCIFMLFFLTACEMPKPINPPASSAAAAQTALSSQLPEISVKPSPENTASPTKEVTATSSVLSHGNTAGNILNWGLVAQNGGFVYYNNTADQNAIYKVPENGGEKTQLNAYKSCYINIADGWIYFCNQDKGWKIFKMRTDGTECSALNSQRSQDIQVVGDTVYFINGNIYAKKGGSICTIQTDGTQEKQLTKDICQDTNIDGGYIYYANWSDGGKIYKMLKDGSQRQKLNDDQCLDINVLDGWIYYRNDKSTRGLYKIKTDGTGRTLLYKGSVYCLNVMDGFIYFCNWENGKKYPGPMYRLSIDGGEPKLLNKAERCSDVNLISGWIYHFVLGNNEEIYRMRTDGSERQKVE